MVTAVAEETQERADMLARRLATSPVLRQRRFELLPVDGPGAPTARAQGRRPGPSTSLTGLADLISSIAGCGLLSPVLIEETPGGSPPMRLIVSGERRVMSIRRGRAAAPDNPHFQAIPAIVCPGPLTEEERRSWQLIENLAREDLQPGELGAALLFERCAVLAAELTHTGAVVPDDVFDEPDPVARYQALERIRRQHPAVGAPWQVVLRRLGLQLSPRKARAVAAALTGLPRELSADLDEHRVALYTRLQLLKVGTADGDAAAELWRAVKQRGRPDLLGAAVRAHQAGLADAGAAADAAEAVHQAGNTARSVALRRDPAVDPTDPAGSELCLELDAAGAGADLQDELEPAGVDASPTAEPAGTDTPAGSVAPTVLNHTLTGLRDLVAELASGRHVPRFDAGSLRLLATQLLQYLPAGPPARQESAA